MKKIWLYVAMVVLFPMGVMATSLTGIDNSNVNTNKTEVKNTNVNMPVVNVSPKVSQGQSQKQMQGQMQGMVNTIKGNTNDIKYEDSKDPTQYNFTSAPMVNTPSQQIAFDRLVANTSATLFDIVTEWKYTNIWSDVKAEGFVDVGEVFAPIRDKNTVNSQITIFKSKEDARKVGNVKFLNVGVLNATEAGVYTLKMEKYLLSKAKSMNANGIIVVSKHMAIETKQGTFGVGAGFSGTMLERLGSVALNLPIGLSYATSTGMGVPKPFISYIIVHVDADITVAP